MSQCVFLWSPPRCVSTAFEFSIRQLPNVKCYHEPFIAPFFIGPSRTSPYYQETPVDNNATYAAALGNIQDSLRSGDFEAIFVKTMSVFLDGQYDILLADSIKNAKHTFLIRHPAHVGLSFSRFLKNNGFQFSPEIMSFKPTYDIYKFVQERLHTNPIVIDSDKGLLNPEGMLEKYCEATGLIYKPGMATKWASQFTLESIGADPLFCSEIHATALQSTGLVQSSSAKPLPSDGELSEAVVKAVKNDLPYYNELKSVAIN